MSIMQETAVEQHTLTSCVSEGVLTHSSEPTDVWKVMKPCGHVTCKTCTDTLVTPAKQCIVCDVKLGDKDVIELRREGIIDCIYHCASDGQLTEICP